MTQAPQAVKTLYDSTMTGAPTVIKTFYLALNEQDGAKLRSILTDDFSFSSALGSFDTPDGFVEMVGQFGGWVETSNVIADGNRIAHTFVYHMTSPADADIAMCDVLELRDGRISAAKTYCNPADFPAMPE